LDFGQEHVGTMTDVSRRVLTLLSLLQHGRAWNGADLARRLGTSPRTLRRDIDRLRDLGYDVETRPGPGGYYRLVAGTSMPPLFLDDAAAVAVAIGLRLAAQTAAVEGLDDEASTRALRQLERLLPVRLRSTVAAVHAATEAVPSPATPVDVDLLRLVGAAVEQQQVMTFAYRDRDGMDSRRHIEPYRQVLRRGRWYLLAWDLDRLQWRSFRLDRVADAATTGERFRARTLPAESASAYLEEGFNAPRHRAVITFLAPLERVAGRLVDRDGLLEPLPGGHCRYVAAVDSLEWLAVTTLIVGVDFRVQEPAGFTAYCAQLRDRLDRATADATPGARVRPGHHREPDGT
jgi:predicted DNA-binding transcriptional regulator YafY